MDKALVVGAGLIHAAVRDGEEIAHVEGELVVISGDRQLFRADFQALAGDAYVLADLCQVFIFVIDQGKGCADSHGGAVCGESAGSDRDSGLFHSADHQVAALDDGVVQDLGAALSVGFHHGYGACKAYAAAFAAHCPCQGLGCQKAGEPVVQILSENGVCRNAVLCAEAAGELHVGLVVIDAYRHAHGDHICVYQGIERGSNACAGGIGPVVCAVFGPGVDALGAVVAADLRIGLVGGDIDAHCRGDVHRVVGEAGHILRKASGVGQRVVYGAAACIGIVRQLLAQRAQHHGHQRAVAQCGGKLAVGRGGDAVELLHHLGVGAAGGGVIGGICQAHDRSDFFKVAVKGGAVGQGDGLCLVLVQRFRVNNDRTPYVSLPVKLCIHIGIGEIDGNGSTNRDSLAAGETGGGGVGLTALAGVQVKIRLLIDLFALIVCAEFSCCSDDVSAAQGQPCALIDCGSNSVIDDIQRHGSVNRDVLGAGAVGGKRLTNCGNIGVGEGLLSADGVLSCYGDRVDVVMDNGLCAERFGIDRSVLADNRLCLCVHIGHGKGRAYAYTLTDGHTADLVLDRQAVVGGGGGSGGIDLVGRLGIQLQNAGKLHLVLCAGGFQIGEDGLRVCVEHRQGKAACHAHVGGACAGDSGGADAIAHIFNLAGIAVLGGKLGNGSLQKQVQTDAGHHLLRFQLLTDGGDGVLVVQHSADKEVGVKKQVCHILKQTVCQSNCPGGDGAQRVALQVGEHDLKDHILNDAVLPALKLLQLRIGKLLFFAEIFDVFIKELLPLFFGEVVQQGVFVLLGIKKGVNKDLSAGFGIRKVAQKLGNDLVHAAAVFRFQDVRADNEIVGLDGLCAYIGLVLVFHIVDCRCRAHTHRAVAGGGVRVDHGVGILKAGDAHVACTLDGHAVRDAGKGLVGMDICRDGGCHLHAALHGLHAGELACLAGHTAGGGAAVFAGYCVQTACRIAQRCGVVFVDLLCRAVRVHGFAGGGGADVDLAADQLIEIRDACAGGRSGIGHGRGIRARGAGKDILAYTADGLCRHLHALGLYAALEFGHGGVVQNGERHCRANACPAAHCLCVGDELADGFGVCGDIELAGHFGHGVVELTHKGPGVHGADRQRHDRSHGDAAGGAGRGLNIEVCLIVCLGLQGAQQVCAEADAVFNLGDGVDVDHFHRDARAHARGVRGHLESGGHGDEDAAHIDAVSGALAGGVGNSGVSAAAGGNDFHVTAVNVIACLVAEHCAVIDIGHMHGDRAADAQLGHQPVGGMARLGNDLGACVERLGFDAQILCADSALADACLVAVHEHFDGDCRADGVFGRSLQAHIGAVLAEEGRRPVQGAVRAQRGNAAACGVDAERRGGADAFCHIHLGKVAVVNIGDAQSAHHLICAAFRRACGGGGVLVYIADAVGAGERIGNLTGNPTDTDQSGNEERPVYGGHLVQGGHVVEGDAQRHGAGSHVGEGVHHYIVHGCDDGVAVDDRPGGVEDKVARDEHAGLGVHVPHVGGLAGGVAGAVHDAGGQNLQRAARVDPGVVGDLRDGLKLHYGKSDGELEGAAHGVGHQVIYRVCADEDAALSPLASLTGRLAGDNARRLSDDHPAVPGGNCQRDGNGYAEKLVCGVDADIHIGAGMDAAAR